MKTIGDRASLAQVNLTLQRDLQQGFNSGHKTGDLRKIWSGHHLRMQTQTVGVVAGLDHLNELVESVDRIGC